MLFLLSLAFAGSTPEVQLGTPYKVVDAADKEYFKVGKEMVSVKVDGDDLIVQHFDVDTLTQTSSLRAKIPDGGQLESLVGFDDSVVLFYSVWDKKNEKEQLFYEALDPKTGTFPAEGQRIVVVDGKVTGTLMSTGFYNISTRGKFKIHHASDGKMLMVEYRKRPEKRDDSVSHDVIGVGVFGPGMKEAWHREFRMPYTEEKMDRLATSVDPSGTAYLLAKVREGEGSEEVVDGEPNYHVEVLKMDATAAEIATTPIEFSGKFVQTMAIFDAGPAGLVGAGLYNNGKIRGSADGFFTVALGKTSTPVFHEIPKEIAQQYATEGEKRKAEKKGAAAALPFMTLERLITYEDGGMTLIAEQEWVEVTTYRSSNGTYTTTYVYHFEDMLLARVDGTGTLRWMRRIPKEQAGARNPGGLSFEHFQAGGRQYVLYFDNVKNLNLPDDQTPAVHIDGRGGFLTAMAIDDSTGAGTKLSIFDSTDVNGTELFQVGVDRIIPISDTTFVMEAYKKKKEDVLVRVTLPSGS